MSGISNEEQLRVGAYQLLAAMLRSAPDQHLLDILTQIDSEDGPEADAIARALAILKLSAAQASVTSLEDEHVDLFIGIGRGELVPYGSWYITGFLMEKPLSQLRDDLLQLGFERQENTHEPEDHIAALCEVMALLIGNGATSEVQKTFFDSHLTNWAARFFSDLETAKSAVFYRSVGQFGKAFVEFEKHYFDMQA